VKALRIHERSIDSLRLDHVPRPEPKPGHVIVRVGAVSLNYRDLLVLQGDMAQDTRLPMIPASDFAGTIVSVGHGVDPSVAGRRVMGQFFTEWLNGSVRPEGAFESSLGGPLPGVLAEYTSLPMNALVKTPKHLSDIEASTLPIAGVTAWTALFGGRSLQPGETLLTIGTGGVSLFAAQIAAAIGANVVMLSGSNEKLARVRRLVPTEGINYRMNPNWDDRVRQITDQRGVHKVVDVAGGSSLAKAVRSLATGGEVASVGFLESGTAEISVLDIMVRLASLRGIGVGSRADFEDLVGFLSKHEIHPVVDAVYPLYAGDDAFKHLRRGAFGKVVIRVHDEEPRAPMHQPIEA